MRVAVSSTAIFQLKKALRSRELKIPDDLLKQGEGFTELISFVFAQITDSIGERFHAALAAFPHQTDSPGGSFEADAAAIFGGVPADQVRALEAGGDAAHGGWTNLFGIGELAERSWAAEDEDRESRELRRTDATFAVAYAQAAKQVNRGGVKLIGDLRGEGLSNRESRLWRGVRSDFQGARFFVLRVFVLDRGHGR